MRTRFALHALAILLVLGLVQTARAESFSADDTLAAIDQASSATGVSYAWLYRVVGCETGHTFNPYAVGDRGTSFGAVQLHRGGGELPRFYARFGPDADVTNPYQAVLFMAEEFLLGRSRAWSCR